MTAPARTEQNELSHGALATPVVVLLVLAAPAPIGAIAGSMSLGFALGNSPGLSGVYLLAGLSLLCFAAGYAAMSGHVTTAGAFYAYIAKGLDRPAGLCAAFIARDDLKEKLP